jgi:hypothetical protein
VTAPAPGLPQDVAITLAVYTEAVRENAVIPFTVGHLDSRESALLAALRAAILAAMRAATAGSGAASAASAASAAHVAPPVSASFEEALTGLDVEALDRLDNGAVVWGILGLDDVRAAHRAEVDRLAARLAEEIKWGHARCTPEVCQSSGVDCPAAIRARGVAKPRTDGEAATRSGEGAKS